MLRHRERSAVSTLIAPWSPRRLSPRYGIHNALEAHQWFLRMIWEHEEFEVETDRAGELPIPFCSETLKRVVVE